MTNGFRPGEAPHTGAAGESGGRSDLDAFIHEFEARTLPRERWTHHAHLAAAFWYLSHHDYSAALGTMRERIRAYNEATGTANTETSGYHETLTQLFLRGVAAHLAQHPGIAQADSLAALLQSPLGASSWPLQFYSRERLFSVAARRDWVEPDLAAAPAHP